MCYTSEKAWIKAQKTQQMVIIKLYKNTYINSIKNLKYLGLNMKMTSLISQMCWIGHLITHIVHAYLQYVFTDNTWENYQPMASTPFQNSQWIQ